MPGEMLPCTPLHLTESEGLKLNVLSSHRSNVPVCATSSAYDGYYVAYEPIILPCISFMFIEMKFIY